MAEVPIIDRNILEKMVRQSINFDQLQEVVKAECDRIVLKVIEPQITHWTDDLAQQINGEVEKLLKKTFGDPENRQNEFKQELLETLVEKIISSEENMEDFIKKMVSTYKWKDEPGEAIMEKFYEKTADFVKQWFEENKDALMPKIAKKLREYLAEPASDLVRRELIGVYDRFDQMQKQRDEDLQQFRELQNRIINLESQRR